MSMSITIKVVPAEMDAIRELLQNSNYDSRSSLIRTALSLLFEKHKLKMSHEMTIEAERKRHRPRRRRQLDMSHPYGLVGSKRQAKKKKPICFDAL